MPNYMRPLRRKYPWMHKNQYVRIPDGRIGYLTKTDGTLVCVKTPTSPTRGVREWFDPADLVPVEKPQ